MPNIKLLIMCHIYQILVLESNIAEPSTSSTIKSLGQ